MADSTQDAIVSLGRDLFSLKLYWVAISALWTYDYFLTLGDEVAYAWKGKKTAVFWIFILNRYLSPIFIVITLTAYFADAWTLDVFVARLDLSFMLNVECFVYLLRCARYGFMETLETMLLTCTAEIVLTLRVYAIANKHKAILFFSATILLWQWGIALYAMSQSSQGTDQPALLLSRDTTGPPGLTELPQIDPFHVCIFISTLTVTPWVEAYLFLSLAFDIVIFLTIIYTTLRATRYFTLTRIMHVIQRDGIIYFFTLFSSNLVWVLLLLHARNGLKFMHNQPAMIISSIMVNRITLNLKRASAQQKVITWGIATFEDHSGSSYHDTRSPEPSYLHNDIELGRIPR